MKFIAGVWVGGILTTLLILICVKDCHAKSWFQFEAGVGTTYQQDVGDGVWQQQGVSNDHEQLVSPAMVVGITGEFNSNLAWHFDYMYAGETKASCLCVADASYNPHTHVASEPGTIPFNGHGHVQGIFGTLEPYWTFSNGLRVGIEVGPFLYFNTWHESRNDPMYPTETDMSHVTKPQLGGVAGLSIGEKNFSLHYRYFYMRQQWNPYPSLVRGVHMLTAQWRF